jgi:hypothetical protein
MKPCSPFKVNQRFGEAFLQDIQGRIISQGRNQVASTLNMEVMCFSETSVGFQSTIRCYTLEDRTVNESAFYLF